MGTVRNIYKNIIFLSSAEVISKGLQFVLMVYAARLLDKASFGKFNFALSLSFIAIIFADMGINTLLIREVARNKKSASRYFVNSFVVKIFSSIITYFLVVIVLNMLSYPVDTKNVVYAIWIFTIISTFTELFYSIFRAFEKMFFDALIKITRMVLLAAAGLYVLFRGYGVLAFSIVFIAVESAMIILAYVIASRNFIILKPSLNFGFMKEIVKKALPFGISFVFSTIYFYIGSVMLSKMKGDVEVAVYSVAYNLALAILFIPTVYTSAIYPVMSRYFKKSKGELVFLYKKSFKYLYIIGLPISAGIFLLADRIILYIYGKEYLSSAIALQIISFSLFIKFLNFLMGFALSSINRQGRRSFGQGIAAVLNVALNLALIPVIGYKGAAWSILITEIFLFIIYYWYVSKFLYSYNFLPMLIKPLLASAAMALLILYSGLGLVLLIPLSAVVYLAAIFLLKTFEKDDYRILRKILKKSDVNDGAVYD